MESDTIQNFIHPTPGGEKGQASRRCRSRRSGLEPSGYARLDTLPIEVGTHRRIPPPPHPDPLVAHEGSRRKAGWNGERKEYRRGSIVQAQGHA